jgi:hypothetical protein
MEEDMTHTKENALHKMQTNAPGDKGGMVNVIVIALGNGDFEVKDTSPSAATPKLTLF